MKLKSMKLKRVIAGAAALAVAATMLPLAGTAQALPLGTPATGAVTISPATGNSGTTFSVTVPPANGFCPGDNTAGYLYHTFITPLSNDPAPMVYSPSGTPTGPAFTNNLANSAGIRSRVLLPGLGDGLVVAVANQTFSNALFAGLTPGAYNVGIACTQPDLVPLVQTMRFWSTPVTITASAGAGPNNFTYQVGVVPAAPVITTAIPGDTTATVNFTHAPSTPATTGYTITANPGALTFTAPAGATSANLTGLTNGTAYSVTMVATNTVGNSPVSNSVSVTPSLAPLPGVTGVTAAPAGPGAITVSWTAPAGPTNPTSYNVTISPVVGISPVSVLFGTNTRTFTGLTAGILYSFTVQPIHTPPNSAPASAPVTAAAQAAQVLNQKITVERPVGALILTQRCGVYNALAAEAGVNAFPGYPFPLGAETATLNQVGTAPIDDDLAPALDGEFPEYPYPSSPTYPTTCGLNMGTATLITTGALAGQYYAASGRLNEVTVVDTRDLDAGWTVNGTMGTFAIVGDTFDGDYLGWTPRITSVAGVLNAAGTPAQTVVTGSGYTQTVTAGAAVLPGTGLGAPTTGMASGRPLASAIVGQGLGITELDARVKVLIPASNNAGFYEGILALTAV